MDFMSVMFNIYVGLLEVWGCSKKIKEITNLSAYYRLKYWNGLPLLLGSTEGGSAAATAGLLLGEPAGLLQGGGPQVLQPGQTKQGGQKTWRNL